MSIIKSKKATIEWKLNPSYFRLVNRENITEESRRLGSSRKAVDAMLAKGEMLRSIMPTIIGEDPTSPNWHKRVKRYWDSLSMHIPDGGEMLEIGFEYDVESNKPDVQKLVKNNAKIKTDEDLYEWVNGKTGNKPNVTEEFKFRYANPINPEQYLLWVYTWNYRDVANNLEDANKSKEIRFYIVLEGELEKVKREQFKKAQAANEQYMLVIKDMKLVNNILYIYEQDPSTFEEDIDKFAYLKNKSESEPDKFLSIVEDKNLQIKADIERMIKLGILNRLSDSQIIIDSMDVDTVIGDTMTEAIAFFKSQAQTKVAKVKEFYTRLNSLTK